MFDFNNHQSDENTQERFLPVITILMGFISVLMFIGINLEGNAESWDAYRKWGSPTTTDIFNGHIWGLLTSNFLHVEVWHIGFNLYWIWLLGKKIEFESSRMQYLFLVISAAIVCSLAQLGFSSTTGIGLSGIVYAFFGYIYVQATVSEEYHEFLDKRTTNLFFIWLVLCLVLTHFKVMNIANAAHMAGLIWGVVIAYSSRYAKVISWLSRTAIFTIIATAFLWNPFGTSWLSHQAAKLHDSQQFDKAMVVYRKILKRDSDSEFAKVNLGRLEKYQLRQKAYKYHSESEYEKAREMYNEILKRDKDDTWAKENLRKLPE